MLISLEISNFAIIRHMLCKPAAGLNIITGETGSGKSVFLDALSLILGGRADIKTQSDFGEKCVVEGIFKWDKNESIEQLLVQSELDCPEELIIRREISPSGKSRSFINDTPVNVTVLKNIGNQLLSIHTQFENNDLSLESYRLMVLDQFCGISELVTDYQTTYKQWSKTQQLLREQESVYLESNKEKEFLQFQFTELDRLALKPGMEANLEKDVEFLERAGEIEYQCEKIISFLMREENSIVNELNEVKNELKQISGLSANLDMLKQRVESVISELRDIARDVESEKAKAQSDPEKLSELNSRLSEIVQLKRKHKVTEPDALLLIHEQMNQQIAEMDNLDQQVTGLKAEAGVLLNALQNKAKRISDARAEAIPAFTENICSLLSDLDMPNARLELQLETDFNKFNELGCNTVDWLFSANSGMPLQSIQKVASGGELSRLALCIKSIENDPQGMRTLVFDEVDTGVSGKIAEKMGQMLLRMGEMNQLIVVTHLPQVASKGMRNFHIFKTEKEGKTESRIKLLNEKEKINEIASMLSDGNPGQKAIANAKELMGKS